MNNLLLLIGFFLIFGAIKANAQIAIAVAKDENGSHVEWQVVWNKGYSTEYTATQKLKDKGYKKVFALTGGQENGHKLTSGYYVVVESRNKNYKGIMVSSIGLGASSNSYAEAEKRAVSNMLQYSTSYKKGGNYSISKQGTF